MYKVFFNDRVLFLTDKIENDLTDGFDALHHYSSHHELLNFLKSIETNTSVSTAYLYGNDKDFLLKALKRCYRFVEAAGGLVLNAEGDILVIERLGVYDLPKGKAEAGETPETTAVREVMEECGLTHVDITHHLCSTFHTYQQKDVFYLKETVWYEMRTSSAQPLIPQTEEHITSIGWYSPTALNVLFARTYPSIKEVFHSAGFFEPKE